VVVRLVQEQVCKAEWWMLVGGLVRAGDGPNALARQLVQLLAMTQMHTLSRLEQRSELPELQVTEQEARDGRSGHGGAFARKLQMQTFVESKRAKVKAQQEQQLAELRTQQKLAQDEEQRRQAKQEKTARKAAKKRERELGDGTKIAAVGGLRIKLGPKPQAPKPVRLQKPKKNSNMVYHDDLKRGQRGKVRGPPPAGWSEAEWAAAALEEESDDDAQAE